ncbi:MAG: galactosyldiacylglycerol synthase [Clostridia bacterium]|nr:galactosyldiacylglycerol synthase [Clostridia bacterium]MBQ9599146.1 galactosyldiacylglycerol synthase [Clostridia bacterium]MBR0028587.1 galactosyldiacylglycerol synthase [Clostridia bacterium]
MKVLLLSVKAGYGHHSTAKAIIEYFEKNGHQCEMLDIFEYISHRVSNTINDSYLLMTKYVPKTYGKAYGKMAKKEEPYDKHSLITMFSRFVSKRLSKYVAEYKPDIMIGTHSYAGICMSILNETGITDCPMFGVVTDFTVHPLWESTFLDYYIIPNELLIPEMQSKGIAKDKALPFGIPIRSQFSSGTEKSEARKALGFEDKPTVLVMMGSMGYGNIRPELEEMDAAPFDFQIICVCGNNKKLKEYVDTFEWTKTVYSYGFTDEVDKFMDAADFIITKPGGLTTSETLSKGLPMIVMNPIPGQEDRNICFLVNTGAAVMVNENYKLKEAINMLMTSPWRVKNMKEAISNIGRPNATADLYDFAVRKALEKSGSEVNSIPAI